MAQHKIIVGVDFSPQSQLAVAEASNLCRHSHERLQLVHFAEPVAPVNSKLKAEWDAVTLQRNEALRERLRAMQEEIAGGLEVDSLIIEDEPSEGLATLAQERGVSLVVVGTHGRTGAQRFLLGSVAERTVRHSRANVLVVKTGGESRGGFQRILMPTDFSEAADAALLEAMSLAAKNACIDLMHFWELPLSWAGTMDYPPAMVVNFGDEIRNDAQARGEAILRKYQDRDLRLSFAVVQAQAANGILEQASESKRHYDAIVMGSRGMRGLRRFLLGSVAEKVVRHAPCSVLVVHKQVHRNPSREEVSDGDSQTRENDK